jgi:hypothetical protein
MREGAEAMDDNGVFALSKKQADSVPAVARAAGLLS